MTTETAEPTATHDPADADRIRFSIPSDALFDALTQTLVSNFSESASYDIQHMLLNRIKECVSDAVTEAMQDRVGALIDQEVTLLLEEGWPSTDSYGNERGPRLTLKHRISNILEGKERYGQKVDIQRMVERAVDNEISGVRSQIQATIADMIDGKLKKAILEAFAK